MKTRQPPKGFSLAEQRSFVAPAMTGIIVVLAGLMFFEISQGIFRAQENLLLFTIGLGGIVYALLYYYLLLPTARLLERMGWVNAIIIGFGLGLIAVLMSFDNLTLLYVLAPLSVAVIAITARRSQAYLVIILFFGIFLLAKADELILLSDWLTALSLPAMTVFISETMRSVQSLSQARVQRLETTNEFARQISSSLDTAQVMALLSAAIQNALQADTYFVGLRDGDRMTIDLLYDDGEFFPPTQGPMEGTLSGWVIRNNQTLFIPDLREEPVLEGVKLVLLGKDKTNLSWLGVPITTANLSGVIVVASYSINAFTRNDVELLESLAQHAAQALDNTRQHAQVELQSHLDSLTNVFNHGYFLHKLREQADLAQSDGTPLSLIMLDIDFFKQYNDQYGHLAGDEVLVTLCAVIRRHIKQRDLVGRWGGEEFVIALPGANGLQASQVAERIRQSISEAKIIGREGEFIPAPTVTQGVAVFPAEADEIYRLIDLADRRLYVAKERGRNQLEPLPEHWGKMRD